MSGKPKEGKPKIAVWIEYEPEDAARKECEPANVAQKECDPENAVRKEYEPANAARKECELKNVTPKEPDPENSEPVAGGSIPLRPHHGMCLAYFEGKGYSEGFTVHMQKMLALFLKEGENGKGPRIRLVTHPDEICTACPNCKQEDYLSTRIDGGAFDLSIDSGASDSSIESGGWASHQGSCREEEKVRRFDRGVLELCGLKDGQEMEFGEFVSLVQERILSVGRRGEICGGCQWESICSARKSRWEE
ncbi:MAG: DUF1284 domain-containing protein [Lachnospiraceae bacterium]|nr:DUF1284 domain-containing protein [Lachnospiraceae bacterium]